MTPSGGASPVDQVLENVVGAINALAESQDDGPGVLLTLGGLAVSGTIIPDWQWFDEVQHAARAAFVVHTGGSVDDEHGGWARLFNGVAQSLMQARDEHRAARAATQRLADRYQRVLAPADGTYYIHLRDAHIIASTGTPFQIGSMHWRGRLSEVSGWSFGHLGAAVANASAHPDIRS
jgi:hypothetical protein